MTKFLLPVVLVLGVILALNWAGVFDLPRLSIGLGPAEPAKTSEPPVASLALPVIESFNAVPLIVPKDSYWSLSWGEDSNWSLSWRVRGADRVSIEPGVGIVDSSGAINVRPGAATDYVLTATNAAGSITKTARTTVSPGAPTPAATTGANRTIFKDDFSNPNSGWYVGSTTEDEFSYYNSSYRILVKKPRWLFYTNRVKVSTVPNYAVEVDARSILPQVTDAGYGIVFGYVDDDNTYMFRIGHSSGEGYYCILRRSGGTRTLVKDWTHSPSIRTGTETNRLKIVCKGTEISAYVNGFHLVTVKESALTDGWVGLIAASGTSGLADVLFDNFEVYVPE